VASFASLANALLAWSRALKLAPKALLTSKDAIQANLGRDTPSRGGPPRRNRGLPLW
jgi:hypothetical protein